MLAIYINKTREIIIKYIKHVIQIVNIDSKIIKFSKSSSIAKLVDTDLNN